MTTEEKITGNEPASTLTIKQHATLEFMTSLAAVRKMKPRECAQDAQRYVESFLAAVNEEIYSPDEE